MKARKLLALGLTAIIGATMMAGCGGGGGSTTSQSSDGSSASGTYAFVAKDVQNPYMQKVYDGFEKACKEIGAEPLYKGPEAATPEKQIEIINQLVAQNDCGLSLLQLTNADGIATCIEQKAMDAGINGYFHLTVL